MPAENAMNVVKAIHRLLRPGGVMNGFEVGWTLIYKVT